MLDEGIEIILHELDTVIWILVWVAVVFVPLGSWKLIDIFLWVIS